MEEKLFEKYTLNNKIEVPGRLVVAPLTLFSSNPDGTINDEEREYLKVRATGMGCISLVPLLYPKKVLLLYVNHVL